MFTPADLEYLGAALRILRMRTGKQQKDIAAATGMSKSQVSRYERGMETPNLTTLAKFLTEVGADLNDLQLALEASKGSPAVSTAALLSLSETLFAVLQPQLNELVEKIVDAKVAAQRKVRRRPRSPWRSSIGRGRRWVRRRDYSPKLK